MVVSQQKYSRYKAAFYLIAVLVTSSCSSSKPHTVIDLHFKTADQIKSVLEFVLGDTKDFNFSGQTILIPPNTDNIKSIVQTIKEIDKPPTAYTINLSPSKYNKRYSTDNRAVNIYLTEGLTTSISTDKYNININIQRATAESSLIKLAAIKNTQEQNPLILKENWIIQHGKVTHPQNSLFPNGLLLNISTHH